MSLALKLSSLLVRTLSKPIANTIKSNAKEHPQFRRLCINFAQAMHRFDVQMRVGRRHKEQPEIKVRPLNDAKAIQNGASFLAESFVFSVAGALVIWESWRSRKKELARQESVADDIKVLQHEINWIKTKLKEKTVIDKDDFVPPDGLKPLVLKVLREEGKLPKENAGTVEVRDEISPPKDLNPENPPELVKKPNYKESTPSSSREATAKN